MESFWDSTTPFIPSLVPYNDAAKRLTDQYRDKLELPRTPAKGPKYNNVVASVLAAFQGVLSTDQGVLYWPIKQDKFSAYPMAGRQILQKTQEAFRDKGLITLVQLGGSKLEVTEVTDDPNKNDQFHFKRVPTLWDVVDEDIMQQDDFWNAEFQEVGRPFIAVGEFQSRADRYYTEIDGRSPPRIPTSQLTDRFGFEGWVSESGVNRLHDNWKDQPLTFQFYKGNSSYKRHASSATRVFSDGSMDRGGRFYGMWSNLSKAQRLRATMNGRPVVEIDIKASQPTLLSGFLGKPMNVGGKHWTDVYGLIVNDIHSDKALKHVDASELKDKVKSVIMEMIGTGNPNKYKPAAANKLSFDMEAKMVLTEKKKGLPFKKYKNEYSLIAHYCKKRVPALYDLKANEIDSLFLAYHESEIISWAMHRLLDQEVNGRRIVSYPMHDCLIVAKEAEDIAVDVLRRCINDHTRREFSTEFNYISALSISEVGKEERVLQGTYFLGST